MSAKILRGSSLKENYVRVFMITKNYVYVLKDVNVLHAHTLSRSV